ncbi:glycosyltransferase family 39 protein [Methylomonas paludis]|uniref:Glycosyltransferase family 39 protein n=1 Tax=Methylomonas paludis TaxID=1173101 RepID=A0A975R9Y1_9GAMM|nr:glycosyltransferase family 39 protein [Methylomonas paludis]QWF70714.1 glycosyltransferase family 39 protein [Methylomonas paludis]
MMAYTNSYIGLLKIKTGDKKNFLKFFAIACCLFSFSLVLKGISKNYSYWVDEIFSVSWGSVEMQEMFRTMILNDVHPPLYQFLLNIWIHVFNNEEWVTRSLSTIFAFFSIFFIWQKGKKIFDETVIYIVIIFFVTHIFFAIYAQEARSYAMLLCFSSVLTISFICTPVLNLHNKVSDVLLLCFLALCLSLTHYFGLIYSGLILVASIYLSRKDVKKSIPYFIAGCILLIWPIIHIGIGTLTNRAGGNFWIISNGPQTTVSIFVEAMLPVINRVLQKMANTLLVEDIVAVVFVGVCFFYLQLLFRNKVKFNTLKNSDRKIFNALALVGMAFIFSLMLIDSVSPISTPRNFIVLLPLFSILIALLVREFIKSPVIIFAFCSVFAAANGYLYYQLCIAGVDSAQNNIAASKTFLKLKKECQNCATYFVIEPNTTEQDTMFRFHEATFYLFKFGLSYADSPKPLRCDNLNNIKPPFIILMQYCGKDIEKNVIDEFKSKLGNNVLGFTHSVKVLYSLGH